MIFNAINENWNGNLPQGLLRGQFKSSTRGDSSLSSKEGQKLVSSILASPPLPSVSSTSKCVY
jgi:hypothetical protein